jgi:hypothetical protein
VLQRAAMWFPQALDEAALARVLDEGLGDKEQGCHGVDMADPEVGAARREVVPSIGWPSKTMTFVCRMG